MTSRNRPGLRICLLATLFAGIPCLAGELMEATAAEVAERLDPTRPGWTRARLRASKLLVSMRVDMRLDQQSGASLDPLLDPPEGNAVAAGEFVTNMTYVTDALGRHSEVILTLDPSSGAALQRIAHDSGKRLRKRSYRFTDMGAMRWTVRPRPGEESMAAQDWTDQSREMRAYPADMPDGPISEASALIYLVGAAQLAEPGDRLEMLGYSSSSDVVHQVTAVVTERDKISIDFDEVHRERRTHRKGKRQALRVEIRGQPLPGQDDDEFELIGMTDIELIIDPDTRAPLQLVGRVPFFGRVRFELDELTLND